MTATRLIPQLLHTPLTNTEQPAPPTMEVPGIVPTDAHGTSDPAAVYTGRVEGSFALLPSSLPPSQRVQPQVAAMMVDPLTLIVGAAIPDIVKDAFGRLHGFLGNPVFVSTPDARPAPDGITNHSVFVVGDKGILQWSPRFPEFATIHDLGGVSVKTLREDLRRGKLPESDPLLTLQLDESAGTIRVQATFDAVATSSLTQNLSSSSVVAPAGTLQVAAFLEKENVAGFKSGSMWTTSGPVMLKDGSQDPDLFNFSTSDRRAGLIFDPNTDSVAAWILKPGTSEPMIMGTAHVVDISGDGKAVVDFHLSPQAERALLDRYGLHGDNTLPGPLKNPWMHLGHDGSEWVDSRTKLSVQHGATEVSPSHLAPTSLEEGLAVMSSLVLATPDAPAALAPNTVVAKALENDRNALLDTARGLGFLGVNMRPSGMSLGEHNATSSAVTSTSLRSFDLLGGENGPVHVDIGWIDGAVDARSQLKFLLRSPIEGDARERLLDAPMFVIKTIVSGVEQATTLSARDLMVRHGMEVFVFDEKKAAIVDFNVPGLFDAFRALLHEGLTERLRS